MPITYTANGNVGLPVNIAAFVAAAQAAAAAGLAAGGPNPRISNGPGPQVNVGTGAVAAQAFGVAAGKTIAWGLITCASVVYTSTNPGAFALAHIHHANAAHVGPADVVAARAALGLPPWASIMVIFAHQNGAGDVGCAASMMTIVGQGVPANNVIEIPNLLVGQFGINNLGQIGF